jgi:class 3 adenylate cyclase
MFAVEESLIDKITETIYYLRTGKVPVPIPIPDDLPDNEIRQLFTFVNRFLVEFALFAEAMAQIARGELNARPITSKMTVVHSFKALQSNLKHLTWKTQQIAAGDLEQKVDFMGDFSTAFNTMTQQLKESRAQLVDLNQQLERRNRFIRETFGRYLSDEIVETILEKPGGLKIGGEKRQATILMSDLRGFTSLCEGLPAEDVVSMVNIYLETMTEIILKYQGTIDEFIGDGILVIFGAPFQRPDDARRAVACAVEMQLAMASVNERNRQAGYPEVALGIGVNTGKMVVGNIGSKKRTKYGVVGRHVNLTARIESYTVGGQILISEDTLKECGDIVRIDNAMQVMPKGGKEPLTIY